MRAASGIKRINLDGLRWWVLDAKGQAEIGFISSYIKILQEKSMDMGLRLKNHKIIYV